VELRQIDWLPSGRYGSTFREAAKRLSLAQSSVSEAKISLEKEVGGAALRQNDQAGSAAPFWREISPRRRTRCLGSARDAGRLQEVFSSVAMNVALGPEVVAANVSNLPSPDHGHRLVACWRSSGSPKAPKAKPESRHSFHIPMILLYDIGQIFHLPQP
jgi:hypothetical protein